MTPTVSKYAYVYNFSFIFFIVISEKKTSKLKWNYTYAQFIKLEQNFEKIQWISIWSNLYSLLIHYIESINDLPLGKFIFQVCNDFLSYLKILFSHLSKRQPKLILQCNIDTQIVLQAEKNSSKCQIPENKTHFTFALSCYNE